MRHVLAVLLMGSLLAGTLPERASGQDPSCEFLEGTTGLNLLTLSGGSGSITYLSSPHIGCPDGVLIVADSAISYSSQSLTHLLGHVRFVDGVRELFSDEARYFSNTGRLQASGNVRLEDASDGSVIENGDLVYFRENEFRNVAELTVTTGADGVRPRALLPVPATTGADSASATSVADAPASGSLTDSSSVSVAPTSRPPMAGDSLAPAPGDSVSPAPGDTFAPGSGDPVLPPPADTAPPTPYEVVGDRLHLVGQGYFEAIGNTVIDRDSVHATADRAEFDEEVGYLLLDGAARLEGDAYDLTARRIRLEMAGGETRRVDARRDGVLTGDQIRLVSPVILLFLRNGALDRLVATPMDPAVADSVAAGDTTLLARPVATAEAFVLVADSVDVLAPNQALDRIIAVGTARGESTARDSLNVERLPDVARRDWMEGDTIVAVFRPDSTAGDAAPATPGPTAPRSSGKGEYVLDRLVASGSARSLYRLIPSEGTLRPGIDPPALHYVTGSRITIVMMSGEVEDMAVEGPTQGYHLEPLQSRPDSAAADSLAADSVAAPDSMQVGRISSARPESPGSRGAPPPGRADPVSYARPQWSEPSTLRRRSFR